MMKWFMRISGTLLIVTACIGLYMHLDPIMSGIIAVCGVLLASAPHEGEI